MELSSNSSEWWPLVNHFPGETLTTDSSADDGNLKDGVTYQQMQGIIEDLLVENGYYNTTNFRIIERTNEHRPYMSS
ncbi:serine/threonine-protein kinase Nek10-like [Cynoglossus semilaevis]|uniref:serine/threonine-protein kinase Nek10-like n=1 Tax=Cynoglossus semilaevis TaxID=244447 RepID=UPI000D6239A6|nr:serine/threonine-protein kinase Nek10-like [Cynoglossus semilaevis]